MGFYDLSIQERGELVTLIERNILNMLVKTDTSDITTYFSDNDTYIRKTTYQAIGKIYRLKPELTDHILKILKELYISEDPKIRQTVINSAGEIGKYDFHIIKEMLDTALFDEHHSVRNAVIGSMKKIGQVNPDPLLNWAKLYLHHPDKEIRREICHGIELRGRTHPQDILPLLRELEFDQTKRVSKTLVHVLGQIAYKKGCLEIVLSDLKSWENKDLVKDALEEIIDVHHRYRDFSFLNQEQVITIIEREFGEKR